MRSECIQRERIFDLGRQMIVTLCVHPPERVVSSRQLDGLRRILIDDQPIPVDGITVRNFGFIVLPKTLVKVTNSSPCLRAFDSQLCVTGSNALQRQTIVERQHAF